MKIKVFCAQGMSSDLIVKQMRQHLAEGDTIEAYGTPQIEEIVPTADVVLLSPQSRAYLKRAQKAAEPHGIPVDVIDMLAFGRRDGKRAYEQALKMYQEAYKG